MIYLIEARRTVGAYKTIGMAYSEDKALEIFEECKKNNGFGCGYKEVYTLTKAQQKSNPDVIKFAKVGGTHYSYAVRIREIEEAN